MQKILITGGAGFLGINLVRYLLKKLDDVVIVSLDINAFDYPEKENIKALRGDIRDVAVVSQALVGVDLVIHTAAALPLYTPQEIMSTDVEGTKNLLDLSLQNGIERFIHISSTAVYGIPDHHPLYEDDDLDGVGPYGQAKIMAENLCFDYRKEGMCIPVIRPKSFVGPERLGVFALFYDWAKDGKNFPMIGSGNNRYQLLDVEDLCQAIYLCATLDREKVNDTFNIGAQVFATMREDYQAVLDAAGFSKKIIPLPAFPVICTLRFLEFFKLSPLYKWVYETAHKDSFVAIEKAQKNLGFTPRFSNRDALLRNYRWYLDNYTTFSGQSGISHRVPWRQGILKFFKLFF